MGRSNYVHLENCMIRKETDGAFLIGYNGSGYWIPKSQIANEGNNLNEGDKDVTVSITEWIAQEKGIEVDDD